MRMYGSKPVEILSCKSLSGRRQEAERSREGVDI